MVIGSVRYPDEQTPEPGREPDEQRPSGEPGDAAYRLPLGSPRDLTALRRLWLESQVDFQTLARQLHSRYGTSRPELNGRLAAVDRLMEALSGTGPGTEDLTELAPEAKGAAGVAADAPRAPTIELAAEPAVRLPEPSDAPDMDASRHDTVVMDTAAIRSAIASDPMLAEVARRLESEESRHDTVPELALLDDEMAELAEDLLDEHVFEDEPSTRRPTRVITEQEPRDRASLRARETTEVELDGDSIDSDELLVEERQRPPMPPDQRATAPVPAEDVEEEPVASGEWPREVELLYEDVHWLFQLGDIDGALISLERLLMLAPENEEIQAFVSLNEKKLLEIYQNVLGAWERVPRVAPRGAEAHLVNHTGEKIRRVLRLVDGKRTVRQILTGTNLGRLEACSALSQLTRARVILFDEVAEPAAR